MNPLNFYEEVEFETWNKHTSLYACVQTQNDSDIKWHKISTKIL